ncbi:MAG: bis(5'-nucleosyl)-tetraphosphatase (symmetrical) YqeK [Actinomycetia bacterium]|nr:bis(5'-nucleosyl)-tetraphosphatase (symmetrical) YqeK [Actinomycetes bacterium]
MAKQKPLINRAERAIARRLDKAGYLHSMGVATMAQSLATIYGQDPQDAFLAGMLHDWDRCRTHKQLLSDAQAHDIKITKVYRDRPRLLHAHTGARGVAKAFPEMKPEIISAIDNHTVGSVPMSDLDKIIFIADSIEPGRNFRRINDLRKKAGIVDLDTLFRLTYRQSLYELVIAKKAMHPNTLKVWNWIILDDQKDEPKLVSKSTEKKSGPETDEHDPSL